MKVVIVWTLGPLIAFGMAAVAGTTYENRAEPEKQRAAQHSRDFALQQFQLRACRPGETAVWIADKEADCLREVRP